MPSDSSVSLSLLGVTALKPVGAFRPLVLQTTGGNMEARLFEVAQAKAAILWLGDARGGFDSPADKLYDRLAERFQAFGVASLRLQYRQPLDLGQDGLDALVGAFLLQQQGIEKLVIVGHGAGAIGAVAAGQAFAEVAGVALLAPHPRAAHQIERLAPKSLLVLHGTADAVHPTAGSRTLLDQAGEPKRIYYYQNTGHELTEAADAVGEDLSDWLKTTLGLATDA